MKSRILIFLFLCLVLKGNSQFTISNLNTRSHLLGECFYYFKDSSNADFETIRTKADFKKQNAEVANFGLAEGAIWIKATLENKSEDEDYKIIIDYPIIDKVQFYFPENDKYSSIVSGENIPFNQRNLKYPNYIFDIKLKKGESKTYYFKIESSEQVILPIYVADNNSLIKLSSTDNLIVGIYAGIFLIMIFYNFFIFISTRDKSYIFYVFYIVFVALTQIGIKGYNFQYLWPDLPEFQLMSLPIFASLAGIAALFFTKEFLQTKSNLPKMHYGIPILTFLFSLSIAAAIFNKLLLSFNIMQLTTSLLTIYIITVSLLSVKKGKRSAMFFAISWIVLMVGAILFLLKDYGVLPFNSLTSHMMLIASAAEIMLLSFALADRIKILQQEKEQSQLVALKLAKENETIIVEQNIMLEKKVDERTLELQKTNESLKSAQAQLINAEKMASLGQLTAGIAHEINNPINYIINSILPLKRDVNDVLELVNKMEDLENKEDKILEIQKIAALRKENDVDFSIQEIAQLLEGIEEGARRTENIVKGLKSFSHLNEEGMKPSDLNEGIRSTLLLLKYKLNTEINLNLQLNATSAVQCNGGNMNQVFMNILGNAIDAVESKFENNAGGEISIETKETGDRFSVIIKDNGSGMDEKAKAKIFDPFFTTKEIGKGTGLGMSIAYGIVEAHRGEIHVESALGVGTTITIQLPINK